MARAIVASVGRALQIGIAAGAGLTERERVRAHAHRPGNRSRFVAAHLLTRLSAAQHLGCQARLLVIRQECHDCGEPHGKPTLVGHPDIGISMSHAGNMVAAFAGEGPVGVDIEHVQRRPVEPKTWQAVLTPTEATVVRQSMDPHREFLRVWVRKEALVKVGVGDLDGLRHIDTIALARPDGPWTIHPYESPTHVGAAVTRARAFGSQTSV